MVNIFEHYKEHLIQQNIYPSAEMAVNHFLKFISTIKKDVSLETKQVIIQNHYEYLIVKASWKGFASNLIVIVEDDISEEYILEGLFLQVEQSLTSKGQEGIYYRWLEENILDLSKSENDL